MKEKQEIKIQSPKKEKQAVKRLGKRKKRARETHTERRAKRGGGKEAGIRRWERPSPASRGFIDRLQIASGGPGDSH